eukprot:1464920-Amphidinium_carterae.2
MNHDSSQTHDCPEHSLSQTLFLQLAVSAVALLATFSCGILQSGKACEGASRGGDGMRFLGHQS